MYFYLGPDKPQSKFYKVVDGIGNKFNGKKVDRKKETFEISF